MDIMKRIGDMGVVPVVVIEDAADAVPAAKALLAGGIDVVEITFRTAAGRDAIAAVSKECPDMLVGAGTVLNLAQCKDALEAGARFIVSPGYNDAVVEYCIEKGVPVLPGCATPTEIMKALEQGLKVIKFFPANVYGGLGAMKALASAFVGIKFMPTGGINEKNLSEYMEAPFIHAVGGTWLCSKKDIAEHNFDKITMLCKNARKTVLGFELGHIGINGNDLQDALAICAQFKTAFDFETTEGKSSCFASKDVEVMNGPYLGKNGHIGIATNSISRALAEMEKRGFTADMDNVKYNGSVLKVAYLKEEIGGFAIHLLQK